MEINRYLTCSSRHRATTHSARIQTTKALTSSSSSKTQRALNLFTVMKTTNYQMTPNTKSLISIEIALWSLEEILKAGDL